MISYDSLQFSRFGGGHEICKEEKINMSLGFVIGSLLWLLPITSQIQNLSGTDNHPLMNWLSNIHQISDYCKILVDLVQVNIIRNYSIAVALRFSFFWRVTVMSKSV